MGGPPGGREGRREGGKEGGRREGGKVQEGLKIQNYKKNFKTSETEQKETERAKNEKGMK